MDLSVFWVGSISKLSARVDIINTVFSVGTRERNKSSKDRKRLAGEHTPPTVTEKEIINMLFNGGEHKDRILLLSHAMQTQVGPQSWGVCLFGV